MGWHLVNVFLIKKCKHLHFGTRREPATFKLKCEQKFTNIEDVTCGQNLGVTIDQALNFSEHISNKVNKANRYLGMNFKTLMYMDKEIVLNLHKSIVSIWNMQQL